MTRSEYKKRYRLKKKADGKCVDCSNPRVLGRSACAVCLNTRKSREAAIRVANGIHSVIPVFVKCTECGRSVRKKLHTLTLYTSHFCSRACYGRFRSRMYRGRPHA